MGCRIQDPGTCGKHQTKKKKSLVYQQGLQGAEFRTVGPVATSGGKQPTFRTACTQRTVRPLGPLVPTLHLLQVLHYKEKVIDIAGCKRCVGTIE